jgi:ribonuclease E
MADDNDTPTTTAAPDAEGAPPAKKAAKRAPRKTAAKAAAATPDAGPDEPAAPVRRTRARKAVSADPDAPDSGDAPAARRRRSPAKATTEGDGAATPRTPAVTFQPPAVAFVPPEVPAGTPEDEDAAPRRRTRAPRIAADDGGSSAPAARPARTPRAPRAAATEAAAETAEAPREGEAESEAAGEGDEVRKRRRRGRRGRGRGRGGEGAAGEGEPEADAPGEGATGGTDAASDDGDGEDAGDGEGTGSTRRRRRRRRAGAGDTEPAPDDPERTVVRVRPPREARPSDDSEVQGVRGSARLEAKRQRRRDGRDSGRKRRPIVTEAEFLARRESVDRVMVVRQSEDRTQIAVLEDDVLVEHYVTKASATSFAGNVYLGRVQNVLPSMEAAFVDIGKGRNAVLYAGEVNYDASALEGRPPRIEQALKSGQSVVVQVTKDPIGSKGARLTSQVSLPGRYMVYIPEQSMTGISRKLPDSERARLKGVLKAIKPEGAGIIIRTAAEGASEEDLAADLNRLKAQWDVISTKAKKATPPELLHGEPDLVIRVVRDLFNEDFASLVVEGDEDYDLIEGYLSTLAPDLLPKLSRYADDAPIFEAYRIDEQIAKALDRKVSLPSGGSLVIDRTEAMTVVDVNTGKFTGKGGNLEETVTRNNLEAAEEVVRQMRLRDIGGMIVVDFIDMILESNRDLVLRRLTECLGRDRTKHQVSEVTSLGLVQMTRKRISEGLYDVFTEKCPECGGRGVKVTLEQPSTKASRRRAAANKPVEDAIAKVAAASRKDRPAATAEAEGDGAATTEADPTSDVESAPVETAEPASVS